MFYTENDIVTKMCMYVLIFLIEKGHVHSQVFVSVRIRREVEVYKFPQLFSRYFSNLNDYGWTYLKTNFAKRIEKNIVYLCHIKNVF